MKSLLLPLAILLITSGLSAQQEPYPVAKATEEPFVVVSPYDKSRRLDVSNLRPGSLAEDPIAKKLFRIPELGNARGGKNEKAPGQGGAKQQLPAPIRALPDRSSEDGISRLPTELLRFVNSYVQKSVVNNPDAVIPFFAERVEDYLGRKDANANEIKKQRSSSIEKFPDREYDLDGPPELLGKVGNIYNVKTRVKYRFSNDESDEKGVVSDYMKIRETDGQFKIVSINQAKAAPRKAPVRAANPAPRSVTVGEIKPFLDRLTEVGELNQVSALVDLLHPEVEIFYTLKNPSRDEIIRERRKYIDRWPGREYSLRDNSSITKKSSGLWDCDIVTDYKIRRGSRVVRGVEFSTVKIIGTSDGLKVKSICTRYCIPK